MTKVQSNKPSYKQEVKQSARIKALTHAVELLTKRREECAIVPRNYVSKIHTVMNEQVGAELGELIEQEDINSWEAFRSSSIGTKRPEDLTVAYLSGPEPTNDLEIFIDLGVRPENIWAFEIDKEVFTAALADIERSKLRGVKLIEESIDNYFLSTPRRFDIIYFDACGPLPSKSKKTTQAIVNTFRHSALTPLGVLITNFSVPDVSNHERDMENYSRLVASYLYPKRSIDTFDNPKCTLMESAICHGYSLPLRNKDKQKPYKDFQGLVKENFPDYYGSFITRHIVDIASIIAPTMRLLCAPLQKQMVSDFDQAVACGQKFVSVKDYDRVISDELQIDEDRYNDYIERLLATPEEQRQSFLRGDEIEPLEGIAYGDAPSHYSLLYTLAACRLTGGTDVFDAVSDRAKKFFSDWRSQLAGQPNNARSVPSVEKAISCFYALRHDKDVWSDPLKNIADFNYKTMPFFCDSPSKELAFYPVFSQVAYPAHNNVKQTRRFSYVAEGKTTTMMLDVLPFDECRYVYDWLPTAPLISEDWTDQSRQFVFRFALDAIAKNCHDYQDDFLYGCHSVGISKEFDSSMYSLREHLEHDEKTQ